MTQGNLFDGHDLASLPQATARRTDPETSHIAASNHERSGNATSHRNILANFVREHPGLTNGEIAGQLPELGLYAISKRMGEVARIGLIRKGESRVCTVNGTLMTTWWPAETSHVS